MALGSIANSPPPSSNAQSSTTVTFDNSGFAVNIGGGQANTAKTSIPTAAQAAGAVAQAAGSALSNPLVIIGVGAFLFLWLKHK